MKKIVFLALVAMPASAAAAQPSALRDPLDSQVPVPTIQYRSAFEDYRPYRDPTPAQWRDANDEVRSFGGHAGHLVKPGASGTSKPANDAAPAAGTKSGSHGGHAR